MEEKILIFLNNLNILNGEKVKLNYLSENLGSSSIELSEEIQVLTKYTDGEELLKRSVYLFFRRSFSEEETLKNIKFFEEITKEINKKIENKEFPKILNIQDFKIDKDARIIANTNNEAIYQMDFTIKYIKWKE